MPWINVLDKRKKNRANLKIKRFSPTFDFLIFALGLTLTLLFSSSSTFIHGSSCPGWTKKKKNYANLKKSSGFSIFALEFVQTFLFHSSSTFIHGNSCPQPTKKKKKKSCEFEVPDFGFSYFRTRTHSNFSFSLVHRYLYIAIHVLDEGGKKSFEVEKKNPELSIFSIWPFSLVHRHLFMANKKKIGSSVSGKFSTG